MLQRCSRIWAARRGIGAVEFAFIAPVLVAILLGIFDFGIAYWTQLQVNGAADAGAQWAMVNGYNAPSIQSAAISATNLTLSNSNITPSNPCGCPTGTGVTLDPNCTTCPDNSAPHQYVVVNVFMCYSPVFHWPGLNYCSSKNTNCVALKCSATQLPISGQSMVLQQ